MPIKKSEFSKFQCTVAKNSKDRAKNGTPGSVRPALSEAALQIIRTAFCTLLFALNQEQRKAAACSSFI
jgi:hypothetical protein